MVNIFNFSYWEKLFSSIVLVVIHLRLLEEIDFLQGTRYNMEFFGIGSGSEC